MLPRLAAMLIAAAAPPAAASPPVWQGVWEGTVGALPVRVCLMRRGDIDGYGAYYYRSRLEAIHLEQQNGSTRWVEGRADASGLAGPAWTFTAVDGAALAGSWRDARRTLPFRLARVRGTDGEDGCGSEAFMAPRLAPVVTVRTPARADGVAYTKLTYRFGRAFREITLANFALLGASPADRRINAAVRALEPVDGPDAPWRTCVASQLAANGIDGDYDATVAPTLITSRWVAAIHGSGYDCGGAHPDGGSTSLLFDRRTGAAVNLNDWLGPTAIERRAGSGSTADVVIRPALRRVVIARMRDLDADCREPIETAEYWDIGLARDGLRFTPGMPHVLTACANDVLVPWSVLARFLNATGRAGRASLAAP